MTTDRIVPDQPTGPPAELPTSPRLVLDSKARLGEGPLWDDRRQVLWWVDIVAGELHCFTPDSGRDSVTSFCRPIGCCILADDGSVIVATPEALVAFDPDTATTHRYLEFEQEEVPSRCNDGKVDPSGRLWIGRLALDQSAGAGSLLRVAGESAEVVLRGLTVPNGLDWSPDGRLMYFVDSARGEITMFDFDLVTGSIGGERRFAGLSELGLPDAAVPDGLSVDEHGDIWLAVWGGGCLLHLASDGSLVSRIAVPAARTSSCGFGGPDLGDLYVTTAREWASVDELAAQPSAGGLWRVRTGGRGRTPNRLALGD